MTHSRTFVFLAAALACGACTTLVADDVTGPDDPAGDLGDELWDDDGPLPGDEASDAAEAVPDLYAVAPRFQVPFPCGQTWAGQTRTNHSPQSSVDFNRANDDGDPVAAAAAGTVTRVANAGSVSYGRWIEISHGNGYTTRYAHLSAQRVSVGQTVRQGQVIGNVGTTGGSTGPHLHYEQRHNGVAVRAAFDGAGALYFGTRNYKSVNACSGSAGVAGRVNTAGAPLTVRAGASTSTAALGSVADGTHVTIRCQQRGQSITGTYGTSTLWDNIGSGYIADAYVATGSDGQVAPTCP
ncbi:MAG: peptidoglycan DD-metalloendopeptidase family protein [Myxococcales bacterium]|nr:peptidoglycan DD-metalloendopeptidase family protein [Myxococcales bacterium]